MKKIRTKKVEYLECDGCEYLLKEEGCTTVTTNWDNEPLEFHFHGVFDPSRSDCFRYWAHNPRVMEKSLKERGFSDEDIEDFMAVMLYRSGPLSPGVEREKVK